jgi:hypothetical protein
VAWGAVLIAGAVAIGWRRAKVDAVAVALMLVVLGVVLAYTYHTLGG